MDSLDKVSDDETQATEKRTPFDKGLDQIPYRFAYSGCDLTPSRHGRAGIEPSPGRGNPASCLMRKNLPGS
jgi:hypothetical protein